MLADYQYILNVPDPIDEDDEYTLMGIVQKHTIILAACYCRTGMEPGQNRGGWELPG